MNDLFIYFLEISSSQLLNFSNFSRTSTDFSTLVNSVSYMMLSDAFGNGCLIGNGREGEIEVRTERPTIICDIKKGRG